MTSSAATGLTRATPRWISVYYQLTGTVAANIDTFNTYYYEFHDELSAGLTADENSITVKIDDETVTAVNNYTASVTNTTDESGAVTGRC